MTFFRPSALFAEETVAHQQRAAASAEAIDIYSENVAPILDLHCFGCHGDGAEEGGLSLDGFESDAAMLSAQEMWWSVIKNVRAEVMPPEGEERLSHEERRLLFDWINTHVFRSDAEQLDPGRVTLRRLNRLEYRNTIRDLMGVEFDTEVEFPPDDSGNGFDNNADALSISPLLAEKYLRAARDIVDRAVPKTSKVMHSSTIPVERFVGEDFDPPSIPFTEPAKLTLKLKVSASGAYRLTVPFAIRGSFDFDPARAKLRLSLDGDVLHQENNGWEPRQEKQFVHEANLSAGSHSLVVELTPLPPALQDEEDDDKEQNDDDEDETFVRLVLDDVRLDGPLDPSRWLQPENYTRFFHRPEPPSEPKQQAAYAREVLRRFCRRAYRRPVDEFHLDSLLRLARLDEAMLAEDAEQDSNVRSFEGKVATAMTAVLASPRFLFRIEQPVSNSKERFPRIDEHALAVRLSYLFWSTMPDQELSDLADRGKLRENLEAQVQRLTKDPRSEAMIRNFAGQWLQIRDVDSVSIDALAALGLRREYEDLRGYLRSMPGRRGKLPPDATAEHRAAYKRYRELRELRGSFDQDLRRDMAEETKASFAYLLRDDRSLLELLDADYAFLNERLAEHYGVAGVTGEKIRKRKLPSESPLGGILTQGTFLAVTSNPTRTSPVKRGLFILDNILGTPAPPAPGEVPELEEAATDHETKDLTLRELLELHRSEPLCQSCHARFDPLGLAFENFTAIGTWRERENGQTIDASGQLITGETFEDVTGLKKVLTGPRRLDFYRCLAERLLSYAIGRDLDYRDEVTLDRIVQRLDETGGKASSLVNSVIQSAPFQRMRREDSPAPERINP